jgi:SAM-dependent methyltransferase
MKWFMENYCSDSNNNKKVVLDVGSYCVKGHSSYHNIFKGKSFEYIGVDMIEGPNVTITLKTPYKWNEVADNFCDILISGQVFEHVEFPWITITEITRAVKPNGLICIIAPNGLGLHRYPVDCWRYYSDGMAALAKWAGLEILHISTNLAPKGAPKQWYGDWQDCMLIARKPETELKKIDLETYICKPKELDKICTSFIPIEEQQYFTKLTVKKIIKAFIPYGILRLWGKV